MTNGASNEVRQVLNQNANKNEEELSRDDKKIINDRIAEVSKVLRGMPLHEVKKKSAELNSLIQFYNNDFNSPDHHILIKTDTYIGGKTAEIISDFLKTKNLNPEILEIGGLKTEEINSFQCALSDIVKDFHERLHRYKESGYEVVFNLTGGFKSIQGFLQVLAMFYASKTIYIFETGSDLLEIPKIPIKIDSKVFEDNLNTFRRLEKGLDTDVSGIPEIYILKVDEDAVLSPYGELAWNNARDELYKKDFFESPSKQIGYTDNFEKTAKSLQPNRQRELNKKIDDLMQYIEAGTNLKSLNFKRIEGSKKQNSTHEFYINSDEAKRGYCHYEDKVLVIDEYGEHL